MMKLQKHFADWEGHVFGFGYGSGEEYTLASLKLFMKHVGVGNENPNQYDYKWLEGALTPHVTWLLINTLCNASIIEYGTSPRFGWLTEEGVRLKEFVDAHSVEELCKFTERPEGDTPCYPDHCNCDDKPCVNPFWKTQPRDMTGGKG